MFGGVLNHRVHRGERLICMAAAWGLFGRAAVWRFRVFFPLTPGPSPPLGARGGFCVFVVLEADVAALAPGRGEGSGVRGDDPAWTLIM